MGTVREEAQPYPETEVPGGVRRLLGDSVFYPCSGLDGRPVQLLGSRWQTFIYSDYGIGRDQLETECRERGFRGYEHDQLLFLPWRSLFRRRWSTVRKDLDSLAGQGGPAVQEPFIAFSQWNRLADFGDEHGPSRFTLWFIRLEAVTTYRELYIRRRVAPRCLVDVCPGLAFGGNYPKYREALEEALGENPAGLPRHFLRDLEAPDRGGETRTVGGGLQFTSRS